MPVEIEKWDPRVGAAETPILGRGAYGMVYSLGNGQCAKVARFSADAFYREAFFLSLLSSHPGVVSLHGIQSDDRGHRILILEECVCTMQRWMASNASVEKKIRVVIDLIRSLELLRRMNLVHADFKPENIMFTSQGDMKIIDFGLSSFREIATTKYTTPMYKAPKAGFGQDSFAAAIGIRQMFGFRKKESLARMTQSVPPEVATVIASMSKKGSKSLRTYLTHLGESPLDVEVCQDTELLGLDARTLDEFDLEDIEYPAFYRRFLEANPTEVENILCTVSLLHWKPRVRKFLGVSLARNRGFAESNRALSCRCSARYFDFFRTFSAYIRQYSRDPHCEVPTVVVLRKISGRRKTVKPQRLCRSRSICDMTTEPLRLSSVEREWALSLIE